MVCDRSKWVETIAVEQPRHSNSAESEQSAEYRNEDFDSYNEYITATSIKCTVSTANNTPDQWFESSASDQCNTTESCLRLAVESTDATKGNSAR